MATRGKTSISSKDGKKRILDKLETKMYTVLSTQIEGEHLDLDSCNKALAALHHIEVVRDYVEVE